MKTQDFVTLEEIKENYTKLGKKELLEEIKKLIEKMDIDVYDPIAPKGKNEGITKSKLISKLKRLGKRLK